MSRPGSPRGSIGGLAGFDKDEDRQALMMDTLGDRRTGERDIKEAGLPAQTAAQEQSESEFTLPWDIDPSE